MQDFEKLGAFYLGKTHDLQQGKTQPDLLLYDSKDLTTHAVCVGMTGSGKTGLCLSLLEEAAIDGIPAIAIDPKGDLGNLLLTFPNLQPADFRPWIEESEATRQGQTPDEYAAATAALWRRGLADWGQAPERIARFQNAADIAIYTPGSSAGLPLTVLRSFAAPPPALIEDSDAYRERISASVSGLLALMGITADPIRSREHILLSNLLDRAWRAGRDLDIAGMIREIQQPPFDKVGFMDLETFFPAQERFELSMSLNNLLASPSFSSWMEGEPLDIKRLLYTDAGRPRLSILSIAHLSEAERMFFVTIVLNEIVAWMRSQPGTSSLRALLYMDEVFGYFPPTANPPSKMPMLTLLKQARAYGLGVVLATQNPVDVDYKGLSNAGTWFLGRLQTERDKARVLEGLEGASATAGSTFDRQTMEATLAGLGSRVFLMNNVHDDQPVVFHTRWALSYLRGPLTRGQIQQLMADRKQQQPPAAAAPGPVSAAASEQLAPTQLPPAATAATTPKKAARPNVAVGVKERFAEVRGDLADGDRLIYRPALLGSGKLHFVRSTYKVDEWQQRQVLVPVRDDPPRDVWDDGEVLGEDQLDWDRRPEKEAEFAPLPSGLESARSFKSWETALKAWLYREQVLIVYKCPDLKIYSEPGESEADFRIRLQQAAREARDLQVEKLRKKFASRLATLQDQKRRAEERVEREKSQFNSSAMSSAVSLGTSVLGALFGRKLASVSNVSRAGTAMRSVSRAAEQRSDIGRAQESVESINEKLEALEESFQEDVKETEAEYDAAEMELEQLELRPRKSDIAVDAVDVAWLPWRVDSSGIAEPLYLDPDA